MHFGTTLAFERAWLSVCFGLALPTSEAVAEPPATDADIHNVVEYAFGDDQVQGDLVVPLGEVLTVRNKGHKHSLVRARGSFVDKLVRSVEDFERARR